MGSIASGGRGQQWPGWDLIYNHYINRMGLAAPYTKRYANMVGPEGGGFDGPGFTTLTHSLDLFGSGAVPSTLRSHVKGSVITISWAGSAYAKSCNVKCSMIPGGPYTTLATVGPGTLFYIDPGLTAGTTCYYVVSSVGSAGESTNSVEISAIPSVAISSNEFLISDHAMIGGTNLFMTFSNTGPGHLYQLLGG